MSALTGRVAVITDAAGGFGAATAPGAGISEAEAEAGINLAAPFGVRSAPEDVAATIAFLVSDDAYVTGASFRVDGGWSVISAG
jgi:NAD(P)-dependent dehydrogenase (short-subunit alcohol dehydrogenase family)